jgi:hypothetical protein
MREADASIERCPAPGTSWSGTPSAAALARPLATGSTASRGTTPRRIFAGAERNEYGVVLFGASL